MRGLTLASLHLSVLSLAAAAAIESTTHQPRSPGFLSLPISRRATDSRLRRRADDVDVPLFNVSTVSYLVELSVGTPGQTVKVAIDTGSSELWVDPNCNSITNEADYEDCVSDGQYTPSKSSTVTNLHKSSTITYGIGQVAISYYNDNVALPNSSIDLSSIQFGVATKSQDLSEGILGLSFGNKTSAQNLGYANFVDQLFMQGFTSSRAFSVALGDQDLDDGGVLIFGGVDTGKFSGTLAPVSILGPQLGERTFRYWVQVESISSTIGGSAHTYDNSSFPVILDTGSTLSSLPTSVVKSMFDDLNASIDDSGDILVECSVADKGYTFDFDFGNVTITVPLSEFLYPATSSICILGATPTDDLALLGDSFLRSAYVVFDQDNMEISMAQWASCASNEQSIGPSVVGKLQSTCSDGENNAPTADTGSGSSSGSSDSTGDNSAGMAAPPSKWVLGTVMGTLLALMATM